jgi:hypothetical protein
VIEEVGSSAIIPEFPHNIDADPPEDLLKKNFFGLFV